MAKKFSPWDSADYINTPKDAALYLEATLEEAGDDPAFIARALGVIARSGNLGAFARETGLSREGVTRRSEDGDPSFATVMKVAKALRVRLEFHTGAS